MFVTRQLTVAIDCHSRKKKYYGSQWDNKHSSKYLLLSSTEEKKLIQAWNKLKVS